MMNTMIRILHLRSWKGGVLALAVAVNLPAQERAAPKLVDIRLAGYDTTGHGFTHRPVLQPNFRHSDSTAGRSAAIVGGVIGGVVGGLAAAGYILNATAYKCTTPGPPCAHDPHTARRVIVITAGTGVGVILGAWVGQLFAPRP